MSKYGDCAVRSVQFVMNGSTPGRAWERATITEFGRGTASQKKGCPKHAFLGLCSNGEVKGIPPGNYTKSVLNKRYAVRAAQLLRSNSTLAANKSLLWRRVICGRDKQHNNQLDVVLALWHTKLLI